MNLHEDKSLLQDAILATASLMGMREVYIEKDYWVTVALYNLFQSHVADDLVFKGGTSLSKCYKLIERFSEDIDLVVVRNQGDTDNQMKEKIRSVSKVLEVVIPEIPIDGLTHKLGNIRKTVHRYDKLFDRDYGQAREYVVVEASWLGNYAPSLKMQVSSYIHTMMLHRGQHALIERYHLEPFTITVLSKLRTFCEKIMSLVRFSTSEQPIVDLKNKIRHVYDLHLMLQDSELLNFFQGSEFDDMLCQVGQDDMKG